MSSKRKRVHTDAVTAAFVEQDKALDASRSRRPLPAQGTLAGASGTGLDRLLGRADRRRGRASQQQEKVAGLPPPSRNGQSNAVVCGAPAKPQGDQEDHEEAPVGEEAEQEEGPQDAWLSDPESQSEDLEGQHEEGHEWEAAGGYEDADAELLISLDEAKQEDEDGGPQASKRKGFTKEDREEARLIHRSHILCLLARAMLLDAAASDPLLQAVALSSMDGRRLPHIDSQRGTSAPSLQPLVAWYRTGFRCLSFAEAAAREEARLKRDQATTDQAASKAEPDAPAAPSAHEDPAKGLQGVIDRLQVVAEERAGTAEEIAAVFVAALRALGLLVRFVRILEASPLRPTLRSSQPWVPQHARQQRGSRKKPPTTTLDLPSPPKGAAADGTGEPNGHDANQSAEQSAGVGNGSGKGKASSRGRGRGRSGGKRKAPEADQTEAPAAAKRKGDEEFENQLAMAMEATAAQENAKPRVIQYRHHGSNGTTPNPSAPGPPSPTSSHPGSHTANGSPPPKGKSPLRGAHSGIASSSWGRRFRGEGVGQVWAEVYCDSADMGKWVHVDPHLGWVDMPERVETATVRGGPIAYIVGCLGGGAKDITQRYVSSYVTAEKHRDGLWWDETLRPLRAHQVAATRHHEAQHPQAGPSSTSAPAAGQPQAAPSHAQAVTVKEEEMRSQREDAELQQRVALEKRGMPTTVDGFKVHPMYVLERHIGKYQALAPGTKKSGLHRGEAFFHRTALSELHTADRWQREGREVLPEARDTPAKINRRRGFKLPPGMDGKAAAGKEDPGPEATGVSETQGLPEEGMTKLYGQWQTRPWAAPVAAGGLVPKNERGNVHAPPFAAALPVGTVHLQMPRLGPVCRRLGVDYAAAMTGFEIRAGRSVPTIDGVVICKENEPMVLEAYIEDERKREEAIQRKRMEAASATWRALLKAIWSRMRVRANYGPPAENSTGSKRATFAPNEAACKPEDMHAALKGQEPLEVDLTEANALPAEPGEDGAQAGHSSDTDGADHLHASEAGQSGDVPADVPQKSRGWRGSAKKVTQQPTAKRKGTKKDAEDQPQEQQLQRAAGNGVHVETEEI
ncbi:hypothetical protein WJX74_010195 [Apatococcus lobatus]|uniref:Uncharacterized protein n=1 Tax=Apatococcus lobatus TaxID=904363 RepID=A0AAW1S496_9CHLO